eukprot:77671-Hanusia_phi.AAC.1
MQSVATDRGRPTHHTETARMQARMEAQMLMMTMMMILQAPMLMMRWRQDAGERIFRRVTTSVEHANGRGQLLL